MDIGECERQATENPSENQSDQFLKMQRTIRIMEVQLLEQRKMIAELQENQKILLDRFTADTATTSQKPVKEFLTPMVSGSLRNIFYTEGSIDEDLQRIKESPNWRKQNFHADFLRHLPDTLVERKNQHDKDLFVKFLHDKADGQYGDDDEWEFRMNIIAHGLRSSPDSILLDHYKTPLFEFVELDTNGKLRKGRSAREEAVQTLFTVVECSSNEIAINEAVLLLIPLCRHLTGTALDRAITREEIRSLVRLINPQADPECLTNSAKLLWIMTDKNDDIATDVYFSGIFRVCQKFHKWQKDDSVLANLFAILENVVAALPSEVRGEIFTNIEYRKNIQILRNIIEESTHSMEVKVVSTGVLAFCLIDGALPAGAESEQKNSPEDEQEYEDYSKLLLEQIPKWTSPVPIGVDISMERHADLLRSSAPACRLYAAWFISNLLTTEEHKYLPIIKKEDIKEALQTICSDETTFRTTRKLCQEVLSQVQFYDMGPQSNWFHT